MSVTGGTLAALVAAASVTQLIRFGGSFLCSRDALEAQGTVRVAPLEGAGTGLRYCVAEEAVPRILGGPRGAGSPLGQQRLDFRRRCIPQRGARLPTLSFYIDASASVGHHGRGAAIRDQRTGGRGRLQLAGAGALGSALV